MSFDIAASISSAAQNASRVIATSFVRRDVFERWRSEHPQWRVDRGVSTIAGVDAITVPEVRAGEVRLTDVAFTTRPGDDVFDGSGVAGKLGANAYAGRIVTIDYPNARLRIE
jgi:hypothetical protein